MQYLNPLMPRVVVHPHTTAVLVDARNWDLIVEPLIEEIAAAELIGFDIETEDSGRHDGLNQFMNVNPKTGRKAKNTPLIFDTRRTTVTGFSIHIDGSPYSYYVNLAHLDEENRVPWEQARRLLDAKAEKAYWIAHNSPYELCIMEASLGYKLGPNTICTLQMAVSAYNADEYDIARFKAAGLGGIATLVPEIKRRFKDWDGYKSLTPQQFETLNKVISKESDAEHSYNGLVKSVRYGYGLKEAVQSFFGYKQQSFEDCLGDAAHMGQITGERCCSYGADDAYWAVKLFHRLLQFMTDTNPAVVNTFFDQEAPMSQVYADSWRTGIRINRAAVERRRAAERTAFAELVRKLKADLTIALEQVPVHQQDEDLAKASEETLEEFRQVGGKLDMRVKLMSEKWYTAKSHAKYLSKMQDLVKLPDVEDEYEQACQIASAVSNAWAEERGDKKPDGVNFTHYMPIRFIGYVLGGLDIIWSKGKVQSDGEARGKMIDQCDQLLKRWDYDYIHEPGNLNGVMARPPAEELMREQSFLTALKGVLTCINEMASIDTRMKLYLTPYMKLADPETNRIYPVLSSELNTRRLATRFPNPMQLSKRGSSTYIRGFYLPDNDDHVIMAVDWSQVELVEIGDFSGDPGFREAYGQIPYQDLHTGAAASALKVVIPEMTEELLKNLPHMDMETVNAINPKILVDTSGKALEPSKAYKFWRTEVGKGSNFNYWYSGALSTVGERLGWTSDQMWEATEAYRERFPVAEQWRVGRIEELRRTGSITLRDGHRRVRYEATGDWALHMHRCFNQYGAEVGRFGSRVIKAVQTRAGNQGVNADIQGSCATLAKRSALRIIGRIVSEGWDARFVLPIHDELVFSVRKDQAIEFAKIVRHEMTNHPDIIRTLPLDATVSIGRTLEPYHPVNAPFGQIELDEAPVLEGYVGPEWEDKKLPDEQQQRVLDYLFQDGALEQLMAA